MLDKGGAGGLEQRLALLRIQRTRHVLARVAIGHDIRAVTTGEFLPPPFGRAREGQDPDRRADFVRCRRCLRNPFQVGDLALGIVQDNTDAGNCIGAHVVGQRARRKLLAVALRQEGGTPAAPVQRVDQFDAEPGFAGAARGGVEATLGARSSAVGRPAEQVRQQAATVEEGHDAVTGNQQLGGAILDPLNAWGFLAIVAVDAEPLPGFFVNRGDDTIDQMVRSGIEAGEGRFDTVRDAVQAGGGGAEFSQCGSKLGHDWLQPGLQCEDGIHQVRLGFQDACDALLGENGANGFVVLDLLGQERAEQAPPARVFALGRIAVLSQQRLEPRPVDGCGDVLACFGQSEVQRDVAQFLLTPGGGPVVRFRMSERAFDTVFGLTLLLRVGGPRLVYDQGTIDPRKQGRADVFGGIASEVPPVRVRQFGIERDGEFQGEQLGAADRPVQVAVAWFGSAFSQLAPDILRMHAKPTVDTVADDSGDGHGSQRAERDWIHCSVLAIAARSGLQSYR
ncbi:MAG: hypothetical protein WDN25_13855 [Acetobacteraceae bacterium]